MTDGYASLSRSRYESQTTCRLFSAYPLFYWCQTGL